MFFILYFVFAKVCGFDVILVFGLWMYVCFVLVYDSVLLICFVQFGFVFVVVVEFLMCVVEGDVFVVEIDGEIVVVFLLWDGLLVSDFLQCLCELIVFLYQCRCQVVDGECCCCSFLRVFCLCYL